MNCKAKTINIPLKEESDNKDSQIDNVNFYAFIESERLAKSYES